MGGTGTPRTRNALAPRRAITRHSKPAVGGSGIDIAPIAIGARVGKRIAVRTKEPAIVTKIAALIKPGQQTEYFTRGRKRGMHRRTPPGRLFDKVIQNLRAAHDAHDLGRYHIRPPWDTNDTSRAGVT